MADWKRNTLFVFLLVAGLYLTGCGAAGPNADSIERTETEETAAEDEITLDWYVNYSWYTTAWGGNAVSEKITEETGIRIQFISPAGNESNKLNALIASDSLPDIITLGWWETQLDEMIEKDMVYALNELAKQYDTGFFEVADPIVCDWYQKEDGNLYCYPNSTYTPKDYETHDDIGSNQTFLVRKDIYEAIGSPDMTTPEGFADAVRKAAAAFPEVDGEPLIPIGAHIFDQTGCVSFDQYLQNFLAVPYEKDGEYYDRYTDPDYIRWLKMFRQLGEEGYLREDIFIDQRTQMEEKITQGRYFCMIYQRTDIEAQQKTLYKNTPERIYIAVDGPKNADGDDHMLPGAGLNGWTVTLISKNCKRPDRALELFTYLMSEHGQMTTYLGVEGVTYDMVDGKPVLKEEVRELLDQDRTQYDRLYGGDNAYWMFQNNVMQKQWVPKYEGPLTQMEEWTYRYTHYLAQYEIKMDSNTEAGYAYSQIQSLWSETLPRLLLAPSEEEFDRILEEFVRERGRLGYEKVKEESTRQIIATKNKLGL
ncbi:MAG: extracellular solute-binding protein [Eubacteriales bacterium]|nr:extracellular solute-binding protein [Eubacteriales bacterium]